jgi:glycerophosphoryl diester phosphodiesterase
VKRLAVILSIVAAAWIVPLSPASASDTVPPAKDDPCPLYLAHRLGDESSRYTENSLSRMHDSVRDGVRCVEMDVRTSVSNSLYVMHDARLRRTTKCTGLVSRKTTRQLDRCDLDSVRTTFDTGVPRVRQVLAYAAHTGTVPVLDIKVMTRESWRRLTVMVSHLGLDDPGDIVVTGDYAHAAPIAKSLLPNAYLVVTGTGPYGAVATEQVEKYDAVSSNFELVAPKDVAAVKEVGRSYFGWTARTPEDFQTCKDLGLDTVFTDDVAGYEEWNRLN